MNNMMLFDAEGKIKKYDTAVEVLRDFAEVRMDMYHKRKAFLLARLTRDCEVLSAKARFVKMVIEGQIVIRRRKITDLAQELRKKGFKAISELKGEATAEEKGDGEEEEDKEDEDDVDEEEEGGAASSAAAATRTAVRDFEYLVGMPISTLTAEKVAELMRQHELKAAELDVLKKTKPENMWLEDLAHLEKLLDERDAAAKAEEAKEKAKIEKAKAAKEKSNPTGKRGQKRSASGPPGEKAEKAVTGKKRSASEERGGGRKKKNA